MSTKPRSLTLLPRCCCGHGDHVVSPLRDHPPRCPHPGCGHGRVVLLDRRKPCIEHVGGTDRDGYGRVAGNRTAHQRAFEEEVRDLLPGETLDHICLNRICIAVWHLDPVSQSVNSQRRWER